MVSGNPIIMQLLLLLVLMFVNSFFTCAEVALISLNKNKLEKMTSDNLSANSLSSDSLSSGSLSTGTAVRSRRQSQAKRILSLTGQPAKFIGSVQVAITIAGFMSSAFAADSFSGTFTSWLILKGLQIPYNTLSKISLVGITLILSFFTIVLCELFPKRLALKKAETIAFASSGIVMFAARIFAPAVWFLTKTTNVILRITGIGTDSRPDEITEEEIRLMIDVGSARGTIKEGEKEILHNVFEFDDKNAGEVMTHRRDTLLLRLDDSDDDWEKSIRENKHSFFPVCGKNQDDIAGVLSSRDYLCLSDHSRETVLKEAVTPAQLFPISIKTNALFRRMKKNRNHFSVILDEHGGMMGIVTMRDLLEELVGDLDDDKTNPPEQPPIVKTGSNTWIINGTVSLGKAAQELGVPLPVDNYDTFAGFVFSLLGRIPEDGTKPELDVNGINIKILEIREHRLEKALVTKTVSSLDEN